ncbi:hypothetical protein ACU81Q_11720 [Komagataeibacter melomenusus]
MVKIGDVFYINTKKGRAYLQYIRKIPRFSYMIRVFSGFYPDEGEQDVTEIVKSPVAFIIFFLVYAADRRRVIHKCGYVPLDEKAREMPVFRYGIPDFRTKKVPVWCFWDGEKEWPVENITDEQRKSPMKIIVNDIALIDKIERGWTPENDPW